MRRPKPISVPRRRRRAACSVTHMPPCRKTLSINGSGAGTQEYELTEVTLVQAINLALAHAMEEDPTVVVLGEDIGRDGGVFRATDGLLTRFGEGRVIDTPLAEGAIAGL